MGEVISCREIGGKVTDVSKKKLNLKKETNLKECGKKALRSCTRCRKNKIRCDSMDTRPDACTNCARKGVECKIDYVTPPQRSKEMKYLFENVRFVESKIGGLVCLYREVLEKNGMAKKNASLLCPTRVLFLNGEFFLFFLDIEKSVFFINNFEIACEELEKSFLNFQKIIKNLLEIYFQWEKVDESTLEKADTFVRGITARGLLERNELLVLLCIVNFYFDIPNVKYLDIFTYVVDSYCYNASNSDVGESKWLSKESLARLIIGNKNNGVQFHSEAFIKNFTNYLFMHIVLYGPEFFMDCFMEKYIGTLETLRKKINFDKNWEVKWVNFYIRLLNLVEARLDFEANDKYFIEDDEIEEIILRIEKVQDEFRSLECIIALIKFDQFYIERKCVVDEKVMKNLLLFVLEKLTKEFDFILERSTIYNDNERICFIHVFFHQLFSLNEILCVNHCGVSMKSFFFNGFNHVYHDYYQNQKKSNILHGILFGKTNQRKVPNDLLGYMGIGIVKEASKIDESENMLEIVKKDLVNYRCGDNQNLNILKCSCYLIWKLYEKVIYWDMFDKLYVHKSFLWDNKLLLENNGLQCQSEDDRWSRSLKEDTSDVKLENVNYYSIEPRRCNSDTGCYGKPELRVLLKEEIEDQSGFSILGEATRNYINEPVRILEPHGDLRGGITQMLQNVDWVKESADDVLRKIHGVIN